MHHLLASERGSLCRVWDTRTGVRLAELRRGVEHAEIQSLSFNLDSSWLLLSSDHGTVHIFKLDAAQQADAAAAQAGTPREPASPGGAAAAETTNTTSRLSFLSRVLPTALTPSYIQSQWSFAQFRLAGERYSAQAPPEQKIYKNTLL